MAYKLSEIIIPNGQNTVTNNDVRIQTSSSLIYVCKTSRVCPHINAGKRIIFEYKTAGNGFFFGVADNLYNTSMYYSGNISWRHHSASFAYINTKYYNLVEGNNTHLGNTFTFIGGYNTVDYYSHIVLEPSSKKVFIYNPITKLQTHEISMSGMTFNNTMSFFISAGGFNSISVHTINPDVDSFKYQPFVEYDTDLYNAITSSPQGDIVVPKTKNILSIL